MDELYQLLKPTDPYYQQWLRFRRGLSIRLSFLPGSIFFISILALIYGLSKLIDPDWATLIGIATAFIYGLTIYFCYPLHCPRCGKRFFGYVVNAAKYLRTDRCVHCNLPLYAPSDVPKAT